MVVATEEVAEGELACGFSSGNHNAYASLLITVEIGARSAATKGARAVGSFVQAVKNAVKRLGSWAVPLANFLYSVLKPVYDYMKCNVSCTIT